jgi:predicted RecA/RadA family phage recombinase
MPNALRTAVPAGDWRSLKFIASVPIVGIKDGEATGVSYLYNVNDTIGAALESGAVGDSVVLIYQAEKILVPKKAVAMGLGQRVWWDPAVRDVTNVKANGLLWIGVVTENAAAADAVVEIDLHGNHAILGVDLT